MHIRTTLQVARAQKRYFTISERKNQMLPIRVESLAGSKIRKIEYLLEVSAFYLANYQFADAARVAEIALRQELSRWFADAAKLMPRNTKAALVKLRSSCSISKDTYTKLHRLLDKKHRFTICGFEDCLNAVRTMAGLPAGKSVTELRQQSAAITTDPRESLIRELKKTYSAIYPRKLVFDDPQKLLLKLRTGCHVSRDMGKRLARLLQAKQIEPQELQDAVQVLASLRPVETPAASLQAVETPRENVEQISEIAAAVEIVADTVDSLPQELPAAEPLAKRSTWKAQQALKRIAIIKSVVGERPIRARGSNRPVEEYTPTPETIAAVCQAIRNSWTDEVRRERLVRHDGPSHWTPPVVSVELYA